jgi:hypothetical protein
MATGSTNLNGYAQPFFRKRPFSGGLGFAAEIDGPTPAESQISKRKKNAFWLTQKLSQKR